MNKPIQYGNITNIITCPWSGVGLCSAAAGWLVLGTAVDGGRGGTGGEEPLRQLSAEQMCCVIVVQNLQPACSRMLYAAEILLQPHASEPGCVGTSEAQAPPVVRYNQDHAALEVCEIVLALHESHSSRFCASTEQDKPAPDPS